MGVQSISENVATAATLEDYTTFLVQLTTLLTPSGASLTDQEAITAAKGMDFAAFKLRDLTITGLKNKTGTIETNFDALKAAVNTANSDYAAYSAGSKTIAELKTSLGAVLTAISPTQADIASWSQRPAIQDNVYYNYSRAGEADLNNQLGQLGDAMDDLNYVLRFTNQIDSVLSVNPRDSSGDSYVDEEGLLSSGFNDSTDLDNFAGSGMNATRYLNAAFESLKDFRSAFASGTSVRSAIDEVVDIIGDYNTSSSSSKNDLKPLWEDTTLRRKVNDLLTSVSSQSDVEKQNLRKAMFIYQEFIKSSGSVMDRIFEAGRSIASRIAR